MPRGAAAPVPGRSGISNCSANSWASRPSSWAMPPWTGRSPCSRNTSSTAPAGGSPTTRFAASCSGSGTPGSGRATSWTPTPSWRKKRRLRRQIRALPPRTALLAGDETDLLLFPPLRAGWALRGQPKEVLLSGRNARRVVFGALNLRTGRRLFLPREHQRAADFQAFLRVVHYYYRGWHVALLLDEDSSHTAKGSVELAGWYY